MSIEFINSDSRCCCRCGNCTNAPVQIEMTITGFADNSCDNCPEAIDGVWILDQILDWRYWPTYIDTTLNPNGGTCQWEATGETLLSCFGGAGNYTVTVLFEIYNEGANFFIKASGDTILTKLVNISDQDSCPNYEGTYTGFVGFPYCDISGVSIDVVFLPVL